ncbi:hypothetical protein G6F61_014481 [Rhizopus arrhizus]|nr:hypothetical protein G6F61_014481 [Rhizopus arrhizus]
MGVGGTSTFKVTIGTDGKPSEVALLTGAGNPSASINLVRKHANSKEFTGSVSAGVGSWNQYRGTVDMSTPAAIPISTFTTPTRRSFMA